MARDHVLLIGIDAYRGADPLFGAANDVDALERILLDRAGFSSGAVTKLVARHKGPRSGEELPTLANIRQALINLSRDSTQPGDRVFIHYSGHGTRIEARGTHTTREALVPVDVGDCGSVLFDYEINHLLRSIAKRTNDVTFLLDCCFSASVTRGAFPTGHARTCRARDVVSEVPETAPAGFFSPAPLSDPGYVVVASAQASETARESCNASGVWQSAFMAAFFELLERRFVGDLQQLRWVDVWPYLRTAIASKSPGQHPCLLGRNERHVFGGPYQHGDAGITLVPGNGAIRLEAGILAGLSEGAEIGVYGPEPAYFEPLGTPSDMQSRRGVWKVEWVDLHSARAVPQRGSPEVGVGARGRLIKPGVADRLVVAMEPFDKSVARYWEQEAHVKVIAWGDDDAEAVVGRAADGRWWIGDEVFGPDAPLGWANPGDVQAVARGLMHYERFRVPLRLARRSADGAHRLGLTVLNATRAKLLRLDELSNPPLPEAHADLEGGCQYRLLAGQQVCFSVWNQGSHRLYVHLLNCASSGKVQLLGTQNVEVLPGKRHIFWMGGVIGEPFYANRSPGRAWNIDRLVAVGTVSPNVDLRCLEVTNSFADAMSSTPRGGERGGDVGVEWAAKCVRVRIVGGEGN